MQFLGEFFVEDLDVVLIHLVETTTLFSSIFGICSEDLQFGCLSRPFLPTASECLFGFVIQCKSVFFDYCLDSRFAHFVFGMDDVSFIFGFLVVLLEFDFENLARCGNEGELCLHLLRMLFVTSEEAIRTVT